MNDEEKDKELKYKRFIKTISELRTIMNKILLLLLSFLISTTSNAFIAKSPNERGFVRSKIINENQFYFERCYVAHENKCDVINNSSYSFTSLEEQIIYQEERFHIETKVTLAAGTFFAIGGSVLGGILAVANPPAGLLYILAWATGGAFAGGSAAYVITDIEGETPLEHWNSLTLLNLLKSDETFEVPSLSYFQYQLEDELLHIESKPLGR
jgi:hypothetical protein